MRQEIVDVCGAQFKVVDRDADQQRARDDNFGEISPIEGIIWLNGKMSKQVREVTLIHEWLHGIYASNGIDHTEQLVSVTSTELYRQGFRVPRIMPPKQPRKPKSRRRS